MEEVVNKKEKQLVAQWEEDERSVFEGWDFSYLKNRMIEPKPPWDYVKIAKRLKEKSEAVLDMETGGGEIFSSLAPFPKHTVAYEGYKPNVSVARKRLKPLGVDVVECRNLKRLPFKDQEFDLVLNRHGAINAKEIYRILKDGGTFFTQQVTGSDDSQDLVKEFGAKRKFSDINLERYVKELKQAGFKIKVSKKWKGRKVFSDVGAIVYYLRAIPWIVKGFSVKNNIEDLKKLQKKIERSKSLKFDSARFMILAEKL
jgi:ubiquinone/menaquinone biosynthesis C-methylase UbiE